MIYIGLTCLILAGIAKSIMDSLNFHMYASIFRQDKWFPAEWWNPEYSQYNKYKDGDPSKGPAFFGATTFLVWTTDAWHLFQLLWGLLSATGYVVLGMSCPWLAIAGYALERVVFELFWSKILKLR
jgi:hypothetical protein